MKKEKKRGKGIFIFICVLVFFISVGIGIFTKMKIGPSWAKKYSLTWNEELGSLYKDISYGDGEAHKFDLYLPKDDSKENYGLVVYLHAGGFTAGDKSGDVEMLSWLCSKGYVACGINYTLRNETNEKSVLSQSNEIKQAIPVVIEKAKEYGYNINEMGIAGGSAGHALAMIYAYRDYKESPVPVKLTFGAVGPSSFYASDWDIYGFDRDTDEAMSGAADLLGVMGGVELTKEEIKDGSYIEKLKPTPVKEKKVEEKVEKTIDELLEETAYDSIPVPDIEKENYFEDIYQNEEEELVTLEDITKREKTASEKIEADETLENDLFELIDSMYENKEEE